MNKNGHRGLKKEAVSDQFRPYLMISYLHMKNFMIKTCVGRLRIC